MNNARHGHDRPGIDPTAIVQHGRTTSKWARLAPATEPEGAQRGQILIMFAFLSMAMLGVLGLATDVGYAMAARRAVQGAADAGAIAGARMIARYSTASPVAAEAEVVSIVTSNTFGGSTVSLYDCEYIASNWGVVGQCTSTVPSTATGSRIQTRLEFPTFFMRIFPGVPDELEVQGYAKARVQRATTTAPDAPFIICGWSAWDVTSNPTGRPSANFNILTQDSPMRINSSAVGKIFRVHDPQLDSYGNADCSSKADRFKGLADQADNVGKTAPAWFDYDTGNKSGPTRAKVNGTEGCDADVDEPYNCVMILPIATNNPAESGNSKQVYVVGFAAFKITTVDANSHNAQLLDDYIIKGGGSDSWCRDCGGNVAIRLIWP